MIPLTIFNRLVIGNVIILAHSFLNEFGQQMEKEVDQFSSAAMKKLTNAPWPGNVRELKNVVEYCVAMSRSPVISKDLIMMDLENVRDELKPFKEAKLAFEKTAVFIGKKEEKLVFTVSLFPDSPNGMAF